MPNKPYKRKKRGTARFVQLHDYLLKTDAWAALKPGPRALYVELKRLFTGKNNGELYLSVRKAADALNVDKTTAGTFFAKLEAHGFIRVVRRGHLGVAGEGRATVWRLTEEACFGQPATKDFMKWVPPSADQQIQKPVRITRTARPKKPDVAQDSDPDCPKDADVGRQASNAPRPNNPDTSTSSHGQDL